MQRQLAGPGVQHRRDAELCAQPLGIAPELEQRLGRCREQYVEDRPWVSPQHGSQRRRQGEDYVEVVGGQDAREPARDPSRLRQRLAFWTMPVTARVVGGLGPAARQAHVQMPAQHGRAAALDGAQHGVLIGSQGVGAPERLAVLADDVCELDGGAWAARTDGCVAAAEHARSASRGSGRLQRRQAVERARHAPQARRRDVHIQQCAAHRAVTEQDLHGAQVHALLEQLRCEAVT